MVRLSELLRALDERGDPSYDLDDIEGGDHIDDHGAYRRPGPAAERSVVLVDTRQAVASALLVLASAQTIAVDCEGIDLDRHGKLCLLALSPSVEKVYLFDVSVLGRDAFTSEAAGVTVKGLLESSAVRKLLYDVRADSDALYHQFGVRLAGILDLQIAEVAVRRHVECLRVRYVCGLAKALDERLPYNLQVQRRATGVSKEAMAREYANDPRFWDRRPLSPRQLQYAADDVAYLHALDARLTDRLPQGVLRRVLSFSETRSKEYDIPYSLLPKKMDRAVAPSF